MTPLPTATSPRRFQAAVVENRPASTGLIHVVVECDHPLEFLPGQFAMLNFTGPSRRTFGRPFSILAAAGRRVEFLYRVVGGGTADLARLGPGDELTVLGTVGPSLPGSATRPAVGAHFRRSRPAAGLGLVASLRIGRGPSAISAAGIREICLGPCCLRNGN